MLERAGLDVQQGQILLLISFILFESHEFIKL